MKEVEWGLKGDGWSRGVYAEMILTKIGGGAACPREQGGGKGEIEKEKEHLQWSEEEGQWHGPYNRELFWKHYNLVLGNFRFRGV